jgi:hypothetical protein
MGTSVQAIFYRLKSNLLSWYAEYKLVSYIGLLYWPPIKLIFIWNTGIRSHP